LTTSSFSSNSNSEESDVESLNHSTSQPSSPGIAEDSEPDNKCYNQNDNVEFEPTSPFQESSHESPESPYASDEESEPKIDTCSTLKDLFVYDYQSNPSLSVMSLEDDIKKTYLCPYCNNSGESQYSRHLRHSHPNCPEIKEVDLIRKFLGNKKIKIDSEHRELLKSRIKFVFKLSKNITFKNHNDVAKHKKTGFLIPDRLPKYATDATFYKECRYCKSVISKKQMSKHSYMCKRRSKAKLDYVISKIPPCPEISTFTAIINLMKLESSKRVLNDDDDYVVTSRKQRKMWSPIEMNLLKNLFEDNLKNKVVPTRKEIAKAIRTKPVINQRAVSTILAKLKMMLKNKQY
jgi:hypothetical protein